jgi:hypothetical protein
MNEGTPSVQIAHVLFLDIVGYSKASLTRQPQLLAALNEAATRTTTFIEARQQGKVLPLATGDGMALLFLDDVTAPARCAIEITQALTGEGTATVPIRMGVHTGLVQSFLDISGNENRVGEGINTAQRVMDFGDAGHILLSPIYADWLSQFDEWRPLVIPVGEGMAKHGQRILLSGLFSSEKGFGRNTLPSRLASDTSPTVSRTKPDTVLPPPLPPVPPVDRKKVMLLYKRDAQPDENVLKLVEERLQAEGYQVLLDRKRKMTVDWARASDERIRSADAVIAIVSPESLQSEMLEWELEAANDQLHKTGKPLILPVNIGNAQNLKGPISAIVNSLTQFRWEGPQDDRRLVAELLSAIREPITPRTSEVKLESVGGAVPPDSPFYIERTCDQEMVAAVTAKESILLIKGPRQVGKTSLQARGAQLARKRNWRVAVTDFQKLNAAQMANEDTFYRLLAATLARQLKFPYDFASEWEDLFGANLNMENFLRSLLEASDEPLIWCMDEVDKLFKESFASDFFGLVRSWHNSRSTEPDGPWNKLVVIIAYATEAHLFIQDLNQSPFNVGRRLDLADLNLQQLVDLNGRYGSPLRSFSEAERLHELIGGQPFLSRRALDVLATGKWDIAGLLEQAPRSDGPFSDHLKRILVSVTELPEVTEYIREVLRSDPSPITRGDQSAYYRLLAAGVISQDREGHVRFRCELYRRYLANHLG